MFFNIFSVSLSIFSLFQHFVNFYCFSFWTCFNITQFNRYKTFVSVSPGVYAQHSKTEPRYHSASFKSHAFSVHSRTLKETFHSNHSFWKKPTVKFAIFFNHRIRAHVESNLQFKSLNLCGSLQYTSLSEVTSFNQEPTPEITQNQSQDEKPMQSWHQLCGQFHCYHGLYQRNTYQPFATLR